MNDVKYATKVPTQGSRDAKERTQEDLRLNAELGLAGQMEMLDEQRREAAWEREREAAREHAKVTVDRGYPLITQEKIDRMLIKWWERLGPRMAILTTAVIGVVVAATVFVYFRWAHVSDGLTGVTIALGITALAVALCALFGGVVFVPFKELKCENIRHTKEPIPYGAKLKIKEALESKLFDPDSFSIFYPIEGRTPSYNDPVITADSVFGKYAGGMHLIYTWNVKDVEYLKQIVSET